MKQQVFNNKIISASILSANLAKLGEDIDAAIQAGVDWIHFDVMDNHFVPNLTFGPTVCQSLRNYGITVPIDVHLMVTKVDRLIIDFAKAGASIITIHPESTTNIEHSLSLIKEHGCKAGIALSPDTSIDILHDIANKLDLILIMSVYPGFAGQEFITNTFKKIESIKKLLKKLNCNTRLSIDGGVTLHNLQQLSQAGINIFVAGNSIFKKFNQENGYQDIITNINKLIN